MKKIYIYLYLQMYLYIYIYYFYLCTCVYLYVYIIYFINLPIPSYWLHHVSTNNDSQPATRLSGTLHSLAFLHPTVADGGLVQLWPQKQV